MTDLDVPDLPAFVAAARERRLDRVVLAWQEEWAQAPDQDAVDYRRIRRTVLLGYAGGVILRLTLDGEAADRVAVAAALRAAGLAVEERCRNLGASDHAR